jgi:hypothetical protein
MSRRNKEPLMERVVSDIQKHTIERILAKQDDSFRSGFNQRLARALLEYSYYLVARR